MMVVGTANRPATPAELDEMKRLLAEGLEQGAVGMSSGLTYTPGMFADTAELVELCRVVAEYGGYYSPHQRSYGKGALEAYAEMIEVARQSGCALHLTHATMNFEPNHGRAVDLLAMIDEALADGVDITTDTYPYLPGATTLAAILPSWTAEGGPDALLARLADPADRERITYELEQVGTDGCHGCVTDWNTIEIGGVKNPTLERRGRQHRGRDRRRDRQAAGLGVLRPAGPGQPGHHDPAARRPRGERAGDHAAPDPHGWFGRDPGRRQAASAGLGHVPPVSRRTTSASWACSSWPTASTI